MNGVNLYFWMQFIGEAGAFLAFVVVGLLLWCQARTPRKAKPITISGPPVRQAMLEEVKAIIGEEAMARVAGAEWALRTLQAPEKVRLAIDAWWRLSPAARESILDPHAWLTGKYDSLRRLGEERR